MSNKIPIINYILHIAEDTYFWLNISIDHLIVLNELAKQKDVSFGDETTDKLNHIYVEMENSCKKLNEIMSDILGGERNSQFIMDLSSRTISVLQEIIDADVEFVELLGEMTKNELKSLYLLLINHITIEEKYSLEKSFCYINDLKGYGFH